MQEKIPALIKSKQVSYDDRLRVPARHGYFDNSYVKMVTYAYVLRFVSWIVQK